MLPFRKILCPIDFSDISLQALDVAVKIAEDFQSELCILHVVDAGSGELGCEAYGMAELEQKAVERGKKHLAEFIALHLPSEINARGLTSFGNAASEIERTVEAEGIDLLVMATRGLTGWRHFMFGSVTEQAVRMSSCPVLAIHSKTDDSHKMELPLRRILCPTDFSGPALEALLQANELALHYGAKLDVLHVVWTSSDRVDSGEYAAASFDRLKVSEAEAHLSELISENTATNPLVRPIVRLGITAEQIERVAREEVADLIVIATHGTSGWHRLFYGSVAEQVLRQSEFPILVIHGAPKP